MKGFFLACTTLLLLTNTKINAQNEDLIKDYINAYKELAIAEMHRTGVPASIKLAQGIHETAAGTSVLVQKSNNHFGIKCKSNWQGESVSHDDDARGECFRKYSESEDSYKDHSDFLKVNKRYATLFELDPLDYKGWANGLKKAGYATNPRYPQLLIGLIEKFNLQDYSLIAMNQKETEQNIAKVAGNFPKEVSPASVEAPPVRINPVVIEANTTIATAKIAKEYPQGVFKLNSTKVLYAPAGTSLFALAMEHNVQLKKLYEYNELPAIEELSASQLIYLQRKKTFGLEKFHIVANGETLQDIAATQAIRLESLLAFNHLSATMQPAAGEKLYLQSKAPARPKLTFEKSVASY